MANATVRKVGNTLMLEIPSDVEQRLHLVDGSQVELEADPKSITLARRSKYSLNELLLQCDFSQPMDKEEREWLESPPAGRELI